MGEIAFGASVFALADGAAVVLRERGGAFAERARATLDAPAVAVASAGASFVALSTSGRVSVVDAATGEITRTADGGAGAELLAAASDGAFVAAGPQGVALVAASADGAPMMMDLRGATALSLSPGLLAIGGKDGTLRVLDTRAASALGACRVGGVVRGLARASRAYWVASTEHAIVRVEREAGEAFVIVDAKELDLGELTCDPEVALVAVRVGLHRVALFDLLEGKLRGTLRYEAPVTGVAFAPREAGDTSCLLGVALGGGAFDVVSITTRDGGVAASDGGGEGIAGVAVEIRLKSPEIAAIAARARAGEEPPLALRQRPADASAAPLPTRAAIFWMMAFTAIVLILIWLLRF
ncbi:MAG TPA: hypothetical protein VGM56_02500 [Byssovorax sp.]|jgi:hypothetical protein